MGLDLASVQLLCCAKSLGVDFSETLVVGRQTLFCDPGELQATLSAVGLGGGAHQLKRREFGDPLFNLLGAREVCSLDASDYQQPTYVCDLNFPCPPHLSNRFSLVYDGGSLEHVFNIPQALKTCMEMVRVGGSFVQVTAANNFMGHGFWQFSPEAMFRVFSPENGYRIKGVFLHEVGNSDVWYQVADPEIVGSRVELVNNRRTYICTIAERVADKPVFASFPCQSDYARLWKRPHVPPAPQRRRAPSFVRSMVPAPIRKSIRSSLAGFRKTPSPFDRRYYRAISADDFIHGQIDKLTA